MKEQSGIETNQSFEDKESEPKGREVDVYLFRHGEAVGEGTDAELSPQGVEQAKKTISDLLKQITEKGGGAVKFISSPVRRAAQTAEIMQSTLEQSIAEQGIQNIRILSPRTREVLKAAGVIGPLKQQGIENPIEYWLNNPESLEGKSPQKLAEQMRELIVFLKKVADRLPPGEKIYYVGVTHEVPQAALLNQLTGKTLEELGGGIKNCEPITIQLEGKSDHNPKITFRDLHLELDTTKKKE